MLLESKKLKVLRNIMLVDKKFIMVFVFFLVNKMLLFWKKKIEIDVSGLNIESIDLINLIM